MKKLITIIFCISLLVNNQIFSTIESSKKWGVIWAKEKELKIYEEDPEADAIILYDIGDSFFYQVDKHFEIRFTHSKRIKILTNAGTKYAEISIPFIDDGFGKREVITKIEAFSYNYENGELIKSALDKNTIYEEKVGDRSYMLKFVIPNVKVGTIIEYRYVLETPFLHNLPDWFFQDRIPTLFSKYTVNVIPFYKYSFITQGIKEFFIKKSERGTHLRRYGTVSKSFGRNVGGGVEFHDIVHTYAMKDVPAFKDESYITSMNDYIMKIDFQLAKIIDPEGETKDIITTWPKLIKDFLKNREFGKYLKKCDKIANDVLRNDIKIDQVKPENKIQYIIEYVKSSYNWDGHYNQYSSKLPKELLFQKTGNSADINLFLVSLLRSAGVNAFSVIISTRDHGQIKTNYPYPHYFNHVVVLVENEDQIFLTDATNNHIAYNRIPPICINERGLVVDNRPKPQWVNLYLNPLSYELKTIQLDIDSASQQANATVYIQSTEYEAFTHRSTYRNDLNQLKKLFIEGGLNTVEELKTENFNKTTYPYIIAGKGKASTDIIDEQIIIYPFLKFPINENKLTQTERLYPVDFIYSRDNAFHSVIHIPNDYQIRNLPSDYQKDDEIINISIEYIPSVNGVEVSGKYTLKKPVYYQFEYNDLKKYLDIIIRKFNEPILIKKIK